ncbi:MAG: DnaD domain protein, partial [Clostridia bacterium]|nr:DnaD domain protein [Clostridia bacterium]
MGTTEKRRKFLINAVYFSLFVILYYLFIKFALWIVAPFILAFLIAMLLQKPIRRINEKTHINKKFLSIVFVLLILAFLAGALTLIGYLAGNELYDFGKTIAGKLGSLPAVIESVKDRLIAVVSGLPGKLGSALSDSISGIAEKALGLDGARLSAALSAIGLSEPEKQAQTPPPRTPVQTLPEYTGEELSQALSDPNFGFIYEQAEKAFNRPLRRHELSTLLALYEDVGVSAEVLALVLTYCTQRASQQTPAGENVRISFSQVRTEALRWHEAGVSNAEQA